MFGEMLNHECNIYHLVENTADAGFGIKYNPAKAVESIPSLQKIPCHFHTKTYSSIRIVQDKPFSVVDGETKLSLPHGTDIRMNDTVEDCRNGLRYRAGVPSEVHGGHHVTVTLYREGGIKSAL